VNGRIYPKEVLERAIKEAFDRHDGQIFIIRDIESDLTVIDIRKIIGIAKSFTIEEDGTVLFDINFIDAPASDEINFVSTVGMGEERDNVITSFSLTCLAKAYNEERK
jgi:hypothetical protein